MRVRGPNVLGLLQRIGHSRCRALRPYVFSASRLELINPLRGVGEGGRASGRVRGRARHRRVTLHPAAERPTSPVRGEVRHLDLLSPLPRWGEVTVTTGHFDGDDPRQEMPPRSRNTYLRGNVLPDALRPLLGGTARNVLGQFRVFREKNVSAGALLNHRLVVQTDRMGQFRVFRVKNVSAGALLNTRSEFQNAIALR